MENNSHTPFFFFFGTARAGVLELRNTVANLLSDDRRGEIIRRGIRLAIFGPPNAGKSSLLNYLGQFVFVCLAPHPSGSYMILIFFIAVSSLLSLKIEIPAFVSPFSSFSTATGGNRHAVTGNHEGRS